MTNQSPAEALRHRIEIRIGKFMIDQVGAAEDDIKPLEDLLDNLEQLFTAYAATVEREALEMIKDHLPDPNNHVEEWRGHNLGLSQAIFLIDEELDRLAALQGPIQEK